MVYRQLFAFLTTPWSLCHLVRACLQLERQRTLKKQYQLLEGLQELKMQDGDVSYLAPEYQEILQRGEAIKAQYRDQPQHLDHLVALIKQLYIDFCM